MPIQHALWTVGTKPCSVATGKLVSEQQLEEMIVAAPEILSGEWMLIGRQEQAGLVGRIDLLETLRAGPQVTVKNVLIRTVDE